MSAFYVHNNGLPANQTRGISAQVRSELDAIAASFTLMPSAPSLASGLGNYLVDTGVADAYVATAGTQVTAYADGQTFLIKAVAANTTASTVNISALGLKSVVRPDGTPLVANDIAAGQIFQISYNATAGNFQLALAGTSAAVSATAAAASAAQAAADVVLTHADVVLTHADVVLTNDDVISSAASAVLAANSAVSFIGTSSTSRLMATGLITLTTQASKNFVTGQFMVAASNADATNYMFGQVSSYSGTTLIINVTLVGGSGTYADWNISISGARGTQGTQGIQGDTGATGAGVLARVEVSGTTQTATTGNDYWLENVAVTAVTAPASTDTYRFKVTPANGLLTNTIDFGAATVRGPAGTMTGILTMELGLPMDFEYSSTLSQWVWLS